MVLDHNALDKRRKIFCFTTYLETKSFKIVLKWMQSINMIMTLLRRQENRRVS